MRSEMERTLQLREGRAGWLCVELSESECGEVGKREVKTQVPTTKLWSGVTRSRVVFIPPHQEFQSMQKGTRLEIHVYALKYIECVIRMLECMGSECLYLTY